MMMSFTRHIGALAMGWTVLMGAPALAQSKATAHDHDHSHDHSHDHADHAHDDAKEASREIYRGYFEDAQIEARALSDWAGDWQSVFPLLTDGTLDVVMAHKAESGEKTAEEYRAYYEIGYKTDVDRIQIDGDLVTFHRQNAAVSGRYADDGFEVLTYPKGNRGVRFIFKKTEGDDEAPDFIQFSDHRIAPEVSDHFHLYWGDDRTGLLSELTNWPTYYPAALSSEQIVDEMVAH